MNIRPTSFRARGRPPLCSDLCVCGGTYFVQHTSRRNGLLIRYVKCDRCGKKRKPVVSILDIREKPLSLLNIVPENDTLST